MYKNESNEFSIVLNTLQEMEHFPQCLHKVSDSKVWKMTLWSKGLIFKTSVTPVYYKEKKGKQLISYNQVSYLFSWGRIHKAPKENFLLK